MVTVTMDMMLSNKIQVSCHGYSNYGYDAEQQEIQVGCHGINGQISLDKTPTPLGWDKLLLLLVWQYPYH